MWKRGKIVDKIYISRQRLLDSGGVYLSDYLKTTLQNSESDLILKDGILYKFIQTKLAQKMKTIHLIVQSNMNIPLDLDKYILNPLSNQEVGYSMKFYDDYMLISDYLKREYPYIERQNLAKELVILYEYFLSYKLLYLDWHSKNSMIKDHLKILDIDSALLVDDISSDFRIYEKSAKISLSILCFSLLLNIDFFDQSVNSYFIVEYISQKFFQQSSFLDMDTISSDELIKRILDYSPEEAVKQKRLLINYFNISE